MGISISDTQSRKGSNSGRIILLYKNEFQDWISIVKKSPNFLWLKTNKTTKDIYACGLHIPPLNSQYFNTELFEELENDIELFSSQYDQYSLWETLILEQENIRMVFFLMVITITNDLSEFSLLPTKQRTFDN